METGASPKPTKADAGSFGLNVAIPSFPARASDAHKGSVGRIVIAGGRFDELGMVGAPALAANAAFRTGAGLVQIITTQQARLPVSVLAPCATTRTSSFDDGEHLSSLATDFNADVVAVGPGLSPRFDGRQVMKLVHAFPGGVVVDADGLNALAALGGWKSARGGQVVITPLPGEMTRLMHGLKLDVPAETDAHHRMETATALARQTDTIVVLKGSGTVVADGTRKYVNDTGHSGMATGGAGDVLTGMIAALMGQSTPPFEAAVLGTYLHGLAGDIAGERVGRLSVTACDIVDAIGEAIARHDARDASESAPGD